MTIDGRDYILTRGAESTEDINAAFTLSAGPIKYYLRQSKHTGASCTCEDFIFRKMGTKKVCKHIEAAVKAAIMTLAPFQEL